MIIFTLIHDKKYRLLGKDHLSVNITIDGESIVMNRNQLKFMFKDKRYRYADFDPLHLTKLSVDTMLTDDGGLCSVGVHKPFRDTANTIELTSNQDANVFFVELLAFLDGYHYHDSWSNCNDLVLGVLKCAGINFDHLIEYGNCQHLCCCCFDPFGFSEINTTNVVMKAAEKYKSALSDSETIDLKDNQFLNDEEGKNEIISLSPKTTKSSHTVYWDKLVKLSNNMENGDALYVEKNCDQLVPMLNYFIKSNKKLLINENIINVEDRQTVSDFLTTHNIQHELINPKQDFHVKKLFTENDVSLVIDWRPVRNALDKLCQNNQMRILLTTKCGIKRACHFFRTENVSLEEYIIDLAIGNKEARYKADRILHALKSNNYDQLCNILKEKRNGLDILGSTTGEKIIDNLKAILPASPSSKKNFSNYDVPNIAYYHARI